MIFIEHRRNKISELATVHPSHGVEMDVRSDVQKSGEMHVSHEPWQRGDSFGQWIAEFKRLGIQGPLLLNTKEDGLEEQLLIDCKKNGIENFLFLDTAWPTLIKYVGKGLGGRFMIRISKYEQLKKYDLLVGPGKIEWAWVDCFEGIPLPTTVIDDLVSRGMKICLVSPELQGQSLELISHFSELAKRAHAVCTKSVGSWQAIVPR